jgi:hypothetical protein
MQLFELEMPDPFRQEMIKITAPMPKDPWAAVGCRGSLKSWLVSWSCWPLIQERHTTSARNGWPFIPYQSLRAGQKMPKVSSADLIWHVEKVRL